MTAQEYKQFSQVIKEAPQPEKKAAVATAAMVERAAPQPIREPVMIPTPAPAPVPVPEPPAAPEQVELVMPKEIPWRFVGELYNTYIIVEQGEDAFLIDKHAAHERILFEKLKANQESISSQALLTPVPCRFSPDEVAALLTNTALLEQLGFEIEEFGDNTVLVRQVP